MERFGLDRAEAEADRKVPRQPYRISTESGRTWINRRRLSELPWHLLHASRSTTFSCRHQLDRRQRQTAAVETMKRRVFFDFDWLYSKLKSSATAGGGGGSGGGGGGAAQGLVAEIEYFMELDPTGLGADSELRTLVATLRLVRPYVDRYPESLGVELAGRLARLVGRRGPRSAVDRLVAGCDRLGVELCAVRPVATCFESADLGLRSNIAVRYRPAASVGIDRCNTCVCML